MANISRLEQDTVDQKTALQTAIYNLPKLYKPTKFGELGPQMAKMGPEFLSSQNQLFGRSSQGLRGVTP